jgi:glycosyltransferase involved in cell wall biosynthesis
MIHRKINILYVIDTLFIGGAEQHVATLCKHIDKEKFHVVVCTLFSRNLSQVEPFAVQIEKMGIRVERLGLTTWRDFEAFRKYMKLIDEEKTDIVHAHTVPADFWGCLIAKLFRHCKTVVTLHGPDLEKTRISKLQYTLVNTILSNRIITASGLLKRMAVRESFARAEKVMVIPNQVDIDFFNPSKKGNKFRAEYNIPDDTVIIGSVGRFERSKGFEICFQVFAKARMQHAKLKFILCGYGKEEGFYKAVVKDLGIEKDVIFTGPRMDIDEVMAAIDILLFTPYYGEGFGLVLIEAMASGKPVVASNVYPTPEIVIDDRTGFLPFPEKPVETMEKVDVDPFVKKILFLIRNNDARKTMGSEGRRVAEEKYSTKIIMKQIEALYKSLVAV